MILFINVTINYCFADKQWWEYGWQKSEAINVKLGVRHKSGYLKEYKALFVAKDKLGKEYKAEISVLDDNFGYVIFPDDFDFGLSGRKPSGNYSWKCFVNDKVVADGKFNWPGRGR